MILKSTSYTFYFFRHITLQILPKSSSSTCSLSFEFAITLILSIYNKCLIISKSRPLFCCFSFTTLTTLSIDFLTRLHYIPFIQSSSHLEYSRIFPSTSAHAQQTFSSQAICTINQTLLLFIFFQNFSLFLYLLCRPSFPDP